MTAPSVPQNNRVFIWKAFREWKPVLEDMFGDILTPELEAKVKQNRAIVKCCDDPEAFEQLAGQSVEAMITTEKINEFRQRYSHIRVYHGCRPVDVQSYYQNGVLPSIERKDAQVDRFREIVLSGDCPELTEQMLQQSIEDAGPKEEDLCLVIDDRWIIEQCGLYLIYGSEYMLDLVSNLPTEKIDKYRSALRNIGRPTFIVINLPNTTEYVKDRNIYETIQEMLRGWTSYVAHSRTQAHLFDCTFELTDPLPPEHICSHYHPTKIKDPLMGFRIYDAARN